MEIDPTWNVLSYEDYRNVKNVARWAIKYDSAHRGEDLAITDADRTARAHQLIKGQIAKIGILARMTRHVGLGKLHRRWCKGCPVCCAARVGGCGATSI